MIPSLQSQEIIPGSERLSIYINKLINKKVLNEILFKEIKIDDTKNDRGPINQDNKSFKPI